MGYLESSDADLIALTRQRRAERAAAIAAARPPTIRYSRLEQLERVVLWPDEVVSVSELGRRIYSGARRKKAAQRFRLREWEAGLRHCCYCGVHMTLRREEPTSATTEHRIPRVLGGADDESNWAVSCYRCNEAKGELTEPEFLAVRRGEAFPVPWS